MREWEVTNKGTTAGLYEKKVKQEELSFWSNQILDTHLRSTSYSSVILIADISHLS